MTHQPSAPSPLPGGLVFFSMLPVATMNDGVSPLILPAHSCDLLIVEGGKITVDKRFGGRDADPDGMKALLEALNAPSRPRLVTYTGRTTVLPRLSVAAMRYGLQRGVLASTGDRYASFQTRFSHRYHLDLADVLSNYGAVEPPRLRDLYAAVFGKQPDETMRDTHILHALHTRYDESA